MTHVPFHLLELTIISAQNLAPVSKKLRTYAIAWINPDRKLKTRIDQQGNLNPNWNEKFVFRVDNNFLNSDSSTLIIEICSQGWLRDFPVGNVRVLITDLIPPAIQRETNNKRFVALQIRRPSGRPQGILNMCVTLLDNTMYSMPLYSVFKDLKCNNGKGNDETGIGGKIFYEEKRVKAKDDVKLWRSRSDRTDVNSQALQKSGNRSSSVCNNGSMVSGSICNGPFIGGGSMINGGSMVNGSEVGAHSDVGPSPSVVAAAVAMGLYPTQIPVPRKTGSSILEDWTVEETNVEGLKSKIDRWRSEAPIYDHRDYQRLKKNSKQRAHRHSDGGGGLLSCFGTGYVCEFKIVCGESSKKAGKRHGSASEINLLQPQVDSSGNETI